VKSLGELAGVVLQPWALGTIGGLGGPRGWFLDLLETGLSGIGLRT
jgi:hypothetical protein